MSAATDKLDSVDEKKDFLTHDKDLVQLAGYHEYKRYENPKKIEVDGKKFKVIDTIYGTDSGLDALTVQNVKSGELTIVYVGSQQIKEDWLGTNAKLLSDTPPAQIEAAQKYFDDVTKEFGEVSSVTGNSLAGASANSVAVENPDLLDSLAGDPIFKGIASTGNAAKECIDELIALLEIAEEKCRFLNTILDSKPVEMIKFVTSFDISVESLFTPPRNYLNELKLDIENFVDGAKQIIEKEIPDLLEGGKDSFVDAVVGELNAHYEIINKNRQSVLSQLGGYKRQVQGVANVFGKMDSRLAEAIATNHFVEELETVEKTDLFCVPPSPYLENKMEIKEIQVQTSYEKLKTVAITVLLPILTTIAGVLISIEKALEVIIFTINSVVKKVGWGVGLFIDYEQQIIDAASDAIKPIVGMESTVEGFRKGVSRMISNLPEVLDYFKSYLDTAIFESDKYENVRLYNVGATAILAEMEMVFNDIVYQLSHEQAKAIDATVETSESVLDNIQLLKKQVERGTL